MRLEENIVRLRTEKRLTQEELADLLGVSRQSVSKWESGASVPELDKLIRLSEIFEITVDELVKGNTITEKGPSAEDGQGKAAEKMPPQSAGAVSTAPSTQRPEVTKGNRVAGIIYLCLGFLLLSGFTLILGLGGFAVGFVFFLPFGVCGLVCLLVKGQRIGLWCGWALYVLTDGYLRYATGLTWHAVFQTFRWTYQMNYMRLFIAWLQFLAIVLLAVCTVLSYRREPLVMNKKVKTLYILGWITLAVVWFGWGLVNQLYWAMVGPNRVGAMVYTLAFLLRDALFWALLTALLTATLRLWRTARRQTEE